MKKKILIFTILLLFSSKSFSINSKYKLSLIKSGLDSPWSFSFINQNKRFVILEAGTGVGKSAIGLTVARYMNMNHTFSDDYSPGAYFLTTQKILQPCQKS